MEEENENLNDTMKDELKERQQKEDGVAKRKIKKKAEEKVKNLNRKARKNIRQALFKRVGISAISSFAGIFVILFMLIGIISFITTMPGLVQDKIYEKVFGVIAKIDNWWSGENKFLNDPDSEEMKQARLDLLNYLKDMDLDPVGLGFVASVVTNNNTGEIESYDNDIFSPDQLEKLIGTKKTENREDMLYKYIIANERTYLPDDDGFRSHFGIEGEYDGMLKFDEDDATSWTDVKVNREDKSMQIKATNMVDGIIYDQVFSYNLDSWVGRYGKSTELLLALHIATMSSDLVEEFISNEDLQTKVNIDVEGGEYDVDYSFTVIKDNGEEVAIPIKFGKDSQTKVLEQVPDAIEEVTDEDGNVKLQVNLEKLDLKSSDITVCSLNNFLNNYKYNKHDNAETEEYVDIMMAEAIDSFLGDGQYFVKNEVISSGFLRTKDYYANSTYLCKASGSNWTPDTSSGLLAETDVFEYDDGTYYYIGYGPEQYYSFNINQRLNYPKDEAEIIGRTTYGVYGLKYYIDNIDQTGVYTSLISDKNTQNAITAMLMQIDQYFKYNEDLLPQMNYSVLSVNDNYYFGNIYDGGDVSFDNFDYYVGVNTSDESTKIYVNYSKQWYDCLNKIKGLPLQEAKQELENTLNNIYTEISAKSDVKRNEEFNLQQIVEQLLREVVKVEDEEVITVTAENIQLMHSAVGEGVGEVKFNIPRISSVVNHWYKDLDFSDSYENTSDSFSCEYVSNADNIKITAEFSGDTSKKQVAQPYVIKGNVVTLDGEDVTEKYYQDPINIPKGNVYGNGFEASKKIFTQGYYYVYDGTQETSKGIYCNRILEDCLGGQVICVSVIDGRISSMYDTENSPSNTSLPNFGKNIDGVLYETDGWNDGLKSFEKYEEYTDADGFCEIAYFMETEHNSTKQKVDWYFIHINRPLKYLSPTTNSYEDTKASVERINNALSFMGVVNLRQPVSFDHVITETVTEDGEIEETKTTTDVTALTAFSILEGMKTESSQYIYRDLKEFLIELGYYTKAEFEYLSTNTLSWLLPAYIPKNATNSGHWQENEEEDALKYGAMLYSQKVDEETGEITKEGFTEDLEIVAPGNCRILEVDEDTIEIEFDGISQPEIGMLDKYTMIIKGVKISTSDLITVLDEDEITEIEITVQEAIDGENIVKMGSKIALTGTEDLQIILKNNKGAILSNVEDYMGPKINVNTSMAQTNWHYFYYIPYESGPIDNPRYGPGCAVRFVVKGVEEWAVGICQWTIRGDMNNITPLMQWLYNKDSALCAEFGAFQSWSTNQIKSNYSQIQDAFRIINERDSNKFLALQMEYALEEKMKIIEMNNLEWLLEPNHNGAVAGTLMSLINWRPYWDYDELIDESMTDEEIVKKLMAYAYYRSPYESDDPEIVEAWKNRWESQARLAVDIINGTYTDPEAFVRYDTTDAANATQYERGKNKGYLQDTLNKYGW